jgi:cell fate regulator YaaT (PSP1 superfamily)
MENTDNESIKFDCFRGCTVTRDETTGELECEYRRGCCKLEVYDWLKGVEQEQFKDIFEVRFKNTRKGIYINTSGQTIKMGDLVIVEATNGHDLGIVTLEGPIVGKQMSARGVDPANVELKKIYRKAKSFDIEKWQEAIAREQEVMIEARKIAAEMQLEMKIGDVEFQGDGTKAIFYYIADGRVDFRQLIKVFAEEFRIRIEMKQIGARQEAGLIGGLGVCGRELCCANHITNFQSITTAAARCQDLSLNPQKLAGQCGKLKCCLNYEVAAYLDAQSRIPRVSEPLEFQDGFAYLMKTDILQETLYFSYDKSSLAELFPLKADEVRQVIDMNRHGKKPESLKRDEEPIAPEFVTSVGDDSISRFDDTRKRHKNNHHNRPDRRPNGQDASQQQRSQPQQNAQPQQNRQGGQQRQNRQNWQSRKNRQDSKPQQQNRPVDKAPESPASRN